MAFKWPYISASKGAFGQTSKFTRHFERPFVGTGFKSAFESRFENPLSVKVLLNALKKTVLKMAFKWPYISASKGALEPRSKQRHFKAASKAL